MHGTFRSYRPRPDTEESVLTVALTLAYIFPCIEGIDCDDRNWDRVVNAICDSREVIDCSSEEHPLLAPWGNFTDTSPGAALDPRVIL